MKLFFVGVLSWKMAHFRRKDADQMISTGALHKKLNTWHKPVSIDGFGVTSSDCSVVAS